MSTDNAELVAIYKSARRAGKQADKACYELIAKGVSHKLAAEICWLVETGKPMPNFDPETPDGLANALRWNDGFERAHHGDDDWGFKS